MCPRDKLLRHTVVGRSASGPNRISLYSLLHRIADQRQTVGDMKKRQFALATVTRCTDRQPCVSTQKAVDCCCYCCCSERRRFRADYNVARFVLPPLPQSSTPSSSAVYRRRDVAARLNGGNAMYRRGCVFARSLTYDDGGTRAGGCPTNRLVIALGPPTSHGRMNERTAICRPGGRGGVSEFDRSEDGRAAAVARSPENLIFPAQSCDAIANVLCVTLFSFVLLDRCLSLTEHSAAAATDHRFIEPSSPRAIWVVRHRTLPTQCWWTRRGYWSEGRRRQIFR
jgi:hypothetical protein